MNDIDIDIVIMWVDGSDKNWLKDKNKHLGSEVSENEIDSSANRYRDWGSLNFVFRGIEKFMPWVRKVHFVTNGQKPLWLNTNCSKLNFVKHADFIPPEYLPTFSSHPIELNLHRIKGISEKFILFNDDCFTIKPSEPSDFFKDNLPCDQVSLWRALSTDYSDPMPHIMINNSALVNQNFNLLTSIKNNPGLWLSPRNSAINLILTAGLLPISRNKIPALYYHHLAQPHLKSTFEAVWAREYDILHSVCGNKFRSPRDVSQGLMKYWQIMDGRVHPKNIRRAGYYSDLGPDDLANVDKVIRTQSKRLLCLNDALVDDFDYTKKLILEAFETILPEKSNFEL